ncbi:hypothetical protein [Falsibacillus pallidus]|uniref:hypothetical protein n=1 Tax=Falsibacillus pallidus TaxID=493781 RepID=UPI003D9817B0
MKKWAIAAVLYLALVVVGYSVYAANFKEDDGRGKMGMGSDDTSHKSEEASGSMESMDGMEDSSHDHGAVQGLYGDVFVKVGYENGKMRISLRNDQGKPVDHLEINHEKKMHLIIVDEHLDKYYHLHPERVGAGEYEASFQFPEGSYKAYVDIKPFKMNYHVSPKSFQVGSATGGHGHDNKLTPDGILAKTVDGKKLVMEMSSAKAGTPVTLKFNLDESSLEPYLGAAGHVVILDEKGEHYLHVHPANEKKPVFKTEFIEPGIYKIWAEFMQDGKVRVFPFVVEIKE